MTRHTLALTALLTLPACANAAAPRSTPIASAAPRASSSSPVAASVLPAPSASGSTVAAAPTADLPPEPPPPLVSPDELAAVAVFLGRLAFDKTLAYGALAVDVKLAALPSTVTVTPHYLEWHGNGLGARWKHDDDPVCSDCGGVQLSGLELFDLRVARFSVGATRKRAVTGDTEVACATFRDGLVADVTVKVDKDACECGTVEEPNDLAEHTLPGPWDDGVGSFGGSGCGSSHLRSIGFTVIRGKSKTRGQLSVSDETVDLSLDVRGAAWFQLLVANDKAFAKKP